MKKYIDWITPEIIDYCKKQGVEPEDVWDNYHSKVRIALGIIPEFKMGEDKVTDKQLRIALGVRNNEWACMKKYFPALKEALEADKVYTQFMADLAIMKGVEETNYTNAKMIEMMQKRWNEKYNPKGNEKEVEFPTTLNITIEDKSQK